MRHRLPLLLMGSFGLLLWLVVAPLTAEPPTESLEAVIHIGALFGGPLLAGWAAAIWLFDRWPWPALVMLLVSLPVVLLIGGEIASRLTDNFGRNGWEVYEDREVFGPGARGVWRGVYGTDREYAVPIRKNELGMGFRGPMPGDKGARTRIVFLGDSQTEALQVPLDSTYPRRIERLCPGVEAINLGRSGIGQVEMLRHLRELGPGLDPDVVVASFLAHNDVSDNLPRLEQAVTDRQDFRFSSDPAHEFARRHRLQTMGIVLRRLSYEWRRWRTRNEPEPEEDVEVATAGGGVEVDSMWTVAWARTEAAFDSLSGWAADHGARFGVWITPGRSHAQGLDRHASTEARVIAYLRARQIPVAPVARELLELPAEARRPTAYVGDSHMTARGHAFVAGRLAGWLRDLGWACQEYDGQVRRLHPRPPMTNRERARGTGSEEELAARLDDLRAEVARLGGGRENRRDELIERARARGLDRPVAEEAYDLARDAGLDPAYGIALIAEGISVRLLGGSRPDVGTSDSSEPEWVDAAPSAARAERERRRRLTFRRLRSCLDGHETLAAALDAFAAEHDLEPYDY